MLVLLLTACVPSAARPTWAEARAACDLSDGTYAPAPWSSAGPGRAISEGCAVTLGNAVGLDWDDFGAEPHAVELPDEPVDHVLGAIFTLVSSAAGTCGDIAEALPDGDGAGVPIGDACGDPEAAAAPFWYAWVSERVEVLRFDSDEGCIGRANLYGSASVCAIFTPEVDDEARPFALAATLVHEATHLQGVSHEDDEVCGSFDPDPGGAYGAQARYLAAWGSANAGYVPTSDRLFLEEILLRTCGRIVDRDGFEPCEGVDADRCVLGEEQ